MNLEEKSSVRLAASKKLKGFTLIELIIVMAIIAILAGISSLAIQGFVRDSKLETANNKAQLVYTAVQNALIQAEIRQDSVGFDAKMMTSTVSTAPSYAEMTLRFNNGSFVENKQIEIDAKYPDSTVASLNYAPNAVWNFSTGKAVSGANVGVLAQYKFLDKYVCDNLAADVTGMCKVYVDYTNYTVESVVFFEEADDTRFAELCTYLTKYKQAGTGVEENAFYGVKSVMDHRSIYKKCGIYFGAYPMLDDLPSGSYATA